MDNQDTDMKIKKALLLNLVVVAVVAILTQNMNDMQSILSIGAGTIVLMAWAMYSIMNGKKDERAGKEDNLAAIFMIIILSVLISIVSFLIVCFVWVILGAIF